MTDRHDGDDAKKGGTRGDKPAGEKRVFKPRPLGDAPARKVYPKSFDTEMPGAAPAGARGDKREARGDKPDRKPRDDARAPSRTASTSDEPAGSMRIAKRLARAGVASRRDAEGMIADGRVKLNGKILDTPAVTVTGRDKIEIDNQPLAPIERTRLWLYHKPSGLVTTNRDPEGRPTVFDRLPEDLPRVLSVGRLDITTEGLLLLTNDGGLARILELPATGWLRRYRVRAHGTVTQAQLDELRQGVAIDGVFYGAVEATLDSEKGANVWLTLGLREGKNREVKRILGHLGLDVNRLIRISFGPFQLADMPEGSVREINGRMLRDQLGDRLIEEAGADFDAPIITTFTNAVVQAEKVEAPKVKSEWVSATTERPNRRKFGDAKRTDALGRLDTKPPRPGARDDRSKSDRPERPREDRNDRPRTGDRPERSDRSRDDRPRGGSDREERTGGDTAMKTPMGPRRHANVWTAPGARPVGEKKLAAREERARGRDRPRPSFGADKPTGDRPQRPAGDRPARPAGSRPGLGERPSARPAGERPSYGKPREESGERPARSGAPSRFGDRNKTPGDARSSAPRGDRSDAPRTPRSDGPARGPSRGDGPRGGDAPRGAPRGGPGGGNGKGPGGPKRGPRS